MEFGVNDWTLLKQNKQKNHKIIFFKKIKNPDESPNSPRGSHLRKNPAKKRMHEQRKFGSNWFQNKNFNEK